MKITKNPDKGKALSLLNMAETTFERLKDTDIEKYPSNTLIDYYNIIHNLMESLCTIKGIKFSGEGSHYELIKHICKEYNLDERFIQQLRDYRNRISYEGFHIRKSYITQNRNRLDNIIQSLKIKIELKLND